MDFLGIGFPELLVILIVTLIIVGPKRLPEMAAQLARFIREFRQYSSNITREVTGALEDFEREYKEVQQEWKEVDASVREDARAIEGEVKGAARDASEGLAVDPPKSTPSGGESKPETRSDDSGSATPVEDTAERRRPAG